MPLTLHASLIMQITHSPFFLSNAIAYNIEFHWLIRNDTSLLSHVRFCHDNIMQFPCFNSPVTNLQFPFLPSYQMPAIQNFSQSEYNILLKYNSLFSCFFAQEPHRRPLFDGTVSATIAANPSAFNMLHLIRLHLIYVIICNHVQKIYQKL